MIQKNRGKKQCRLQTVTCECYWGAESHISHYHTLKTNYLNLRMRGVQLQQLHIYVLSIAEVWCVHCPGQHLTNVPPPLQSLPTDACRVDNSLGSLRCVCELRPVYINQEANI